MRRTLVIACLSSMAVVTIAGCGRTVVRETVVERPAVKETIVERPVIQRETVVQSPAVPAACTFGGNPYSSGAMSCQGGYEFRCSAGAWERTGRVC